MNTFSPQVVENIDSHDALSKASRWDAYLDIKLEHAASPETTGGRTRMAHCRHQGPLYVQRPFFPEGNKRPHIYLLHPPGGVVSGDCLKIKIAVESNCAGLFTTPGAGRMYRARADKTLQGQHVELHVGENSSLEWFPLENIIYPGAYAKLTNAVHMKSSSRLFFWDVSSFGLPAQNEMFEEGRVVQDLRIFVDGKPRIIERLKLDDKNDCRLASAGLRAKPIAANFIAGPFLDQDLNAESLETLRELASAPCFRDKHRLVGVSMVHDFLVARYLGHCSESAKKLFTEFWQVLRPELMGQQACLPRIWST
ncbi:MAG: urease accessory protein UreD [Agarilytica sp.]